MRARCTYEMSKAMLVAVALLAAAAMTECKSEARIDRALREQNTCPPNTKVCFVSLCTQTSPLRAQTHFEHLRVALQELVRRSLYCLCTDGAVCVGSRCIQGTLNGAPVQGLRAHQTKTNQKKKKLCVCVKFNACLANKHAFNLAWLRRRLPRILLNV